VSTSIGTRGLQATNKKHLIIEDNIGSFAKQIAQLLEKRALATKLGKEARKLVENTYDWKIITQKLIKIYEELLE